MRYATPSIRNCGNDRDDGGTMMRTRASFMSGLLGAALVAGIVPAAPAQRTVTVVREIDTDRYDPHRSSSRSAAEVLHMIGDTLVNVDYDMKTIVPGLAKEWSMSADGKTYTFKLRDDVSFCSGRKLTAK